MAAINDLISRIQDPELRAQIQAEVNKLSRQKKFGLVFEDHIPECTPLYELPIRVGTLVAKKDGSVNDLMMVTAITDGNATCIYQKDAETVEYPLDQLVAVARFGEPIYPYLQPIDTICNAPESDLWHTLIQADNYHALQLLEYLYAGQVDCIYIDPPYNTGAKDWKYNNDYVDGADSYRHSKWLSFMEKRLKLAKRLLNPKDSVLIVTIDDVEVHTLVLLLQEIYPEAYVQVISSVINPSGKAGMGFSIVHEYIVFVFIGSATINCTSDDMLLVESSKSDPNNSASAFAWESLLRRGASWTPTARPNLFYPVLVDERSQTIAGVGQPLNPDSDIPEYIDGYFAALPRKKDGSYSIWRVDGSKLLSLSKKGYAHVSGFDEARRTYAFRYLMKGDIERIENGEISVERSGEHGEVIATSFYQRTRTPKSIWNKSTHNAGMQGSDLLSGIIGRRGFTFPKSLYAVQDTIRFFVANKPNALIIDFFAGSGTTLHAVNLINAEDGGRRRCIMVTNNEVSAEEAKALTAQGFRPGDEEWEKLGVARYVTWPRTVCSIEGHDVNGQPLKGNYLGSDRPMSEGFPANAAFFRLGFLDKASVRVGRQFKEMLPTLWMKAGCYGPCPTVEGDAIPNMLILPQNHMAVLNNSGDYALFAEQLQQAAGIDTVYLVTDSDADYRAMSRGLTAPHKYQLYRDYLDNFRINSRR